MLWQQERDGVELAAYLVRNKAGEKGVLVLPWFANEKTSSDYDYWDKYGSGLIEDNNGNTYSPFGYIHTHTQSIRPSQADINAAKWFGFDSYILTNSYYGLVDPSRSIRNQPEGIPTGFLLNRTNSLLGR